MMAAARASDLPGDAAGLFRRILVALDASPASAAAAGAAAHLASRFGATVEGLFIEDINLVRAASLPGVRVLGLHSRSRRAWGPDEVQREFRLQTRAARRALERAAAPGNVAWTFRSVRGVVAREVLAAAAEADLLVLGRRGGALAPRLGSTARQSISAACSVLLTVETTAAADIVVAVLLDGADGGVLRAAAGIAGRGGEVVLLAPPRDDAASAAAMADLGARGAMARVIPMHADRLAEALRKSRAGLLIVGGSNPLLHRPESADILAALEVPALVVRGPDG